MNYAQAQKAVIGKQPLLDVAATTLEPGDWLVDPAARGDLNTAMRLIRPAKKTWMWQANGSFAPALCQYDMPTSMVPTWRVVKSTPFHRPLLRRLLPGVVGLQPSVTLGADPELFALDAHDQVVPAWKWLPSRIHAAVANADMSGRRLLYWDGWQAEFTLGANGHCMDGLCYDIFKQLKRLRASLPAGTRLAAKEAVLASETDLAAASDEQVAFGCSPSLNAYGHQPLPIQSARDFARRFAGGHLHFGLYSTDLKQREQRTSLAVKAMDAICGVMCVSLFPGESPLRRRHYGMAGEYRLPTHGLEWRTLSNAWLRAPQLMYLVVGTARSALRLGWEGLLADVWKGSEQEWVECINNSDVALAHRLIRRNAVVYGGIFESLHGRPCDPGGKRTLKVVLAGYESIFPRPMDLAGNWRLDDIEYRYSGENTGRWGNYVAHAKI